MIMFVPPPLGLATATLFIPNLYKSVPKSNMELNVHLIDLSRVKTDEKGKGGK